VWAAWLAASVLLFSYYALWVVATETPEVTLVLQPRSNVHVQVTSLWGHWLAFDLLFHRNPGDIREAELGGSGSRIDAPRGERIFSNPGKHIAATVTVNGGSAVELEAMPPRSYAQSEIGRPLTTNKSTAYGVWTWPNPRAPRIWAARGRNDVFLTITDVDPSLTGERVTLSVNSPLAYLREQDSYGWLEYAWFVGPLGGFALGVTGLCLLWTTLQTQRQRRAKEI
jgi:hypothetical protein